MTSQASVSLPHNLAKSEEYPQPHQRWQAWCRAVGLQPEPFERLEASADPDLGHYFVGHDAFAAAWGSWTSLLFAPPGSGKTALSAHLARACWIGQETNRPFPLPYTVPFLRWGHAAPSLEDHLAAISEAAARHLLLALAHRPHWFFRQDDRARQYLQAVLARNLPGPLAAFLAPCLESQSLEPLRELFPAAFLPPDPPPAHAVVDFCRALEALPAAPAGGRPPALERWREIRTALLDILRLPAVYLMLDGLDAAAETAADANTAVGCLAPVLTLAPDWAAQRVYAKAFLPVEIEAALAARFADLTAASQSARLTWSPDALADVIRRRVFFVTRGDFGSLAAIATPDLSDLETRLAYASPPMPREILVLTRQTLFLAAQRYPAVQITRADLKRAWRDYARSRPDLAGLAQQPLA